MVFTNYICLVKNLTHDSVVRLQSGLECEDDENSVEYRHLKSVQELVIRFLKQSLQKVW